MKKCSRCSKEKPLTEFFQYKSGKNKGHFPYCKECCKLHCREYRRKHPFFTSYNCAQSRCSKNGSYFKKNIKFLMTLKDFGILWYRDKAYLMDRPSIDRIDADGDYVFENCRYIELLENLKRKRKNKDIKNRKRNSLGQFIKQKDSQ